MAQINLAETLPIGWQGRHNQYQGPLTRYVKLWVAHAPGMPGTFSPSLRASDIDMHHGTYVTHVPGCMPGSLIRGFHRSRWRGKCSRHSRRMRNPQFCISGKRPMGLTFLRYVTCGCNLLFIMCTVFGDWNILFECSPVIWDQMYLYVAFQLKRPQLWLWCSQTMHHKICARN